jgi:tRNA1(Val) A37 N6-methylase TrmN6
VSAGDVTSDGFLNNRLRIGQPRKGFRAGHDSVFLAAAVPAKAGDAVLELGSGAGVASLCLAARVECRVLGVELDPALAALANDNASQNGMSDRVRFVAADATSAVPEGAPFDQVFFNPPFHPDSGQVSPSAERDRATRGSDEMLSAWTQRAALLVKPTGAITVILRPDRVEGWRQSTRGDVTIIPLAPKEGAEPKRCIAIVRPGAASRFITQPALVLHESDGRPTALAEAVLRGGAALIPTPASRVVSP